MILIWFLKRGETSWWLALTTYCRRSEDSKFRAGQYCPARQPLSTFEEIRSLFPPSLKASAKMCSNRHQISHKCFDHLFVLWLSRLSLSLSLSLALSLSLSIYLSLSLPRNTEKLQWNQQAFGEISTESTRIWKYVEWVWSLNRWHQPHLFNHFGFNEKQIKMAEIFRGMMTTICENTMQK